MMLTIYVYLFLLNKQIPMGAGGSDPNANKSAYMMSYSVNVPAIMIAHKQKAQAKTDEGIKPWNQTTAPYGAVSGNVLL